MSTVMRKFWRGVARSSRGMSLVELTITITLFGIVALFVLKGRAALESMQALVSIRQLQSYQSAVMTYQANFNALPGDDPNAPARYRRAESLYSLRGSQASRAGNGVLNGDLYDQFSPNGEPFMAWRDLRYAQFVDGDPAVQGASTMPENPFGGSYGFDEGNLGQAGGSLCATRVLGRAAQIIDTRIDDGKINTGKLVATSKFSIEANHHFDAPDTAPYDFEKEYIICVPLLP